MNKSILNILVKPWKSLTTLLAFLLFCNNLAFAQGSTVSGTVTDTTGNPLPGVNINIKGTQTGVVSSVNGDYSINVLHAEMVLVFSYVGFVSQEVAVKNRRSIDITLLENTQDIEEVVVIGYQTVRKSHLTGAISSVKGKELNLTTPSIGQSLVGKVAGVQISQVSGAPYNSTKIRVRGTVSVNASSEPLYVIDGYPSNLDLFLDPEDIESIEILKDAASAAIYGSRASGGVVMITTKRGKESKARVEVNYQHTLGQLSKKVAMLDAQEFVELFVDGHNNSYRDLLVNAGKQWDESYRGDTNAQRTQKIGSNNNTANIPEWMYDFATQKVKKQQYNTDWQDELYRIANGDRLHINITGGSNNVRYNVSGAYQGMEGIIVSTRQDKINLRSNIDMNISRKFKAGANFAITHNNNREVQEGRFHQSPVFAALVYLPVFKCYNEDGTLSKYEMSSYSNEFAFQNDIDNPVALATETIIRRNVNRSTYNVFGTYEFIDGLFAKANLGMYTYSAKYDFYRPTSLTSGVNPPYSVQAQAAANSVALTSLTSDYLGEFTLNYNKQLNKHSFQGVAGFSLQKNMGDMLEVSGRGYQDDHIIEITGRGANASDISLGGSTRRSVWTMASFFAQLQYNFRNNYFLSASFRGDGSSLFGSLNRWGYFPSVSGGWTVSGEEFYRKAFGSTSTLKLRSSWGLSGNNSIGNYNHTQVMSSPSGVPLGNSVVTAMYPEAFKDRTLGWESTSQFNIGLDLTLFNGRLSLITNYYNSHTFNLLFNQSISAISGTTIYLTNLPNSMIRNRGIDLQADGWLVSSKDFSLKVGGNIGVNRNKVLDLGGSGTILTNGAERSYMTHITREGDPIGMFYGFRVAGMVRESDMANIAEDDKHYNASTRKFEEGYKIKGPPRSVAQTAKLMPGDLYFYDTNGDGVVTDEDKDIIGSPHPDFIYAFNLAANYKTVVDFSASFNGSKGNKVLDGQDYYTYNMEGSGNNYKDVAQRYRDEQNPGNGKVYRASRGGTQSNSTRLSTFYLQDGSFLRCTNITLGYSPAGIAKATHGNVSALRIYIAVDNAFTVSKYKGYNPEVDYNNGSNLTPGVDYGKYPLVRAFQAGIQLSF